MQKLSSRSIAVAVAIGKHEEFDTHGALKARKTDGSYGTGRMTMEDLISIRNLHNGGKSRATYVVYSYSTPIAIVFENGKVWRNPNKYSVTTSKHQGKLYKLVDQRVSNSMAILDAGRSTSSNKPSVGG